MFGTILNSGKLLGAAMIALAGSHIGFVGTLGLMRDVRILKKAVKEEVNPTPFIIKRGLFGKKQKVKVSMFTGKMSEYTGSKEPVNKKPINLKKGFTLRHNLPK